MNNNRTILAVNGIGPGSGPGVRARLEERNRRACEAERRRRRANVRRMARALEGHGCSVDDVLAEMPHAGIVL